MIEFNWFRLVEIEKNILSDPTKFEVFFKEKYSSLCFLANKYIHNMHEAEELVQDVFVKLWEKHEILDIKGSEIAYIIASVKNACLNHIKHKKIVLAHEKYELTRIENNQTDTTEEPVDMELENAVIEAIAILPTQRKKIFLMSRVDGLKYHEIAKELGISIKTVEAQMGSALKQLREKLRDYI